MRQYKAGVIGCGRMGGFIDNEWVGGPLEYMLPHSHAAVYEAIDRIDLVACSDVREDVMDRFGQRYNVPLEKQYTDYRQMIQAEKLDIVSITTQPEQRAEIILYACEQGVPALYVEKALCASLEEADRIVEAVQRRRVVFNMGTGRRWDTGYEAMKALVHSGELGPLRTIIIYGTGSLYNSASHWFDLALWINNDAPIEWVEGHLHSTDDLFDGDVLRKDPVGEGVIQFANGVRVYALNTPRGPEIEAVCTHGTVTAQNNGLTWSVRRSPNDSAARWQLHEAPFPEYVPQSTNKRLVEDIVQALDTGGPTRGGVEVARANQEMIAAIIASHRKGGARVHVPLTERHVRLERVVAGRQPRYAG